MDVRTRPVWTRWRTGQLVLALWLLLSPLVYPPGAAVEVVVKDLVVGSVLLAVTAAAAVDRRVSRVEHATCLGLGVLLLVATVVLDDGVGAGSIIARWNEVVVGVLLICLAAARARA